MSSNTLIAEHDGIYVEVVEARVIDEAGKLETRPDEAKLDNLIKISVEKIRGSIEKIDPKKRPDTLAVEFSVGFTSGGWAAIAGGTVSAALAVTATWQLADRS